MILAGILVTKTGQTIVAFQLVKFSQIPNSSSFMPMAGNEDTCRFMTCETGKRPYEVTYGEFLAVKNLPVTLKACSCLSRTGYPLNRML